MLIISLGKTFSAGAGRGGGGFGSLGGNCSVGVGGGLRRSIWLRTNGLDSGLDILTGTLYLL